MRAAKRRNASGLRCVAAFSIWRQKARLRQSLQGAALIHSRQKLTFEGFRRNQIFAHPVMKISIETKTIEDVRMAIFNRLKAAGAVEFNP